MLMNHLVHRKFEEVLMILACKQNLRQFHQHFISSFLHECAICSFYPLTVCVCIFSAKEYLQKAISPTFYQQLLSQYYFANNYKAKLYKTVWLEKADHRMLVKLTSCGLKIHSRKKQQLSNEVKALQFSLLVRAS